MKNQNLTICLLAAGVQALATALSADVRTTESLDRGLAVISTTSGNVVQWRILPSDIANGHTFALRGYASATDEAYTEIATFAASDPSCYVDKTKFACYEICTIDANQQVVADCTSGIVSPHAQMLQLPMNRPEATSTASYYPNDASVADVDGDGQYELILKWNPSTSLDNSYSGKTDETIYDCYEIAGDDFGKQLWRIRMGKNIRSGAHYSPFLVYDFDGDGKAEFVLKTAPGTTDANGAYVSTVGASDDIRNITTNASDLRNGNGHVTNGEEFLTIFNGETGVAMQTVWYNPNRGQGCGSAASYGQWESVAGKSTNYNRGERYGACVAHLDGVDQLPSMVFQRGYYTFAYFWAVDWDGTNLTTRWLHRGTSKTAWSVVDGTGKQLASGTGKSSFGQGVHGISVGDVDDDGFDEIVMGSATIDHDGKLLCSTGFGHGDAIHLGKIDPDREGLQIYMPHEESGCGYGDDLHDAATGEVLFRGYTSGDNGRGIAGDFFYKMNTTTGLDEMLGWELFSGAESVPYNFTCDVSAPSSTDKNFRLYWNGDLYDDSFDGRYSNNTGITGQEVNDHIGSNAPRIQSWNGSKMVTTTLSTYGGSPRTCNVTKATPCLIADIWGDWREEIICWEDSDPSLLDIYTTVETTQYPVPCLMTDHVYRMGIAWQNVGYNQPPHLGYYLPDAFLSRYVVSADGTQLTDTLEVGQEIEPLVIKARNAASITKSGTILSGLGMTTTIDLENQTVTVSGAPTKKGTFSGAVVFTGTYNKCTAPVKFVIVEATSGIGEVNSDMADDTVLRDLCGRRIAQPSKGQPCIVGRKVIIY
ncbi:MAG: rhamnogalacturonan lyase [Bacteroidales bacterium]|nr:rhamnogalacturonan lyase [Bacteroidales bacterium]